MRPAESPSTGASVWGGQGRGAGSAIVSRQAMMWDGSTEALNRVPRAHANLWQALPPARSGWVGGGVAE